MNRKVICAIRLYDDFTGKLLKDNIYSFKLNTYPAVPIAKSDGYFVFTGERSERLELTIEAPNYIIFKQNINPALFSKEVPIIDCRLLPNTVYERRIDRKVIGKITPPNTEVILIPQTEKPILKYGGQIDGQPSCIMINTLMPISLININFIVNSDIENEIEVFQIKQRINYNQFELSHVLKKEYKLNAEIIRVYRSISKEDGSFIILADDFYDTDKYLLIYKEEKVWKKEIYKIG